MTSWYSCTKCIKAENMYYATYGLFCAEKSRMLYKKCNEANKCFVHLKQKPLSVLAIHVKMEPHVLKELETTCAIVHRVMKEPTVKLVGTCVSKLKSKPKLEDLSRLSWSVISLSLAFGPDSLTFPACLRALNWVLLP